MIPAAIFVYRYYKERGFVAQEAGLDPELEEKLKKAETFLLAAASLGCPSYELAQAVADARKRLESVLAPGWWCSGCKVFNSDAKERLSACRCCGLARRT